MSDPKLAVELLKLTRHCRGIDKYVSSRAELTIDEMHCLSVLFSDHPSSVKRLSELINASSTRTSKILKDLEMRGLVSRTLDTSDRRKEIVVLTDEGANVIQNILSLYDEVGSELLSDWRSELRSDLSWLFQTVAHTK